MTNSRTSKKGRKSDLARMKPLVPNTTGRILFIAILAILIVADTLCIVNRSRGVALWQLEVSIVIQSLSILLIILASTSANFFRLHGLNCSVLWVLGMLLVGIEAWMLQSPPALPEGQSLQLGHISNIIASYVELITGFLLLLPPTLRISALIHPFRFESRRASAPSSGHKSGGRKVSSVSTSGSTTSQQQQQQHHHHREVQSIYEDWPDPIPFPVTSLYNFNTTSESELNFTKGESLMILDCRGNWWQAKNPTTGSVGFIPSNFVQVLQKAKVIKRHLASSEDEASIQEEQVVEVMEHHDFLSLVRTVEGKIGSVPTECLQLIHDPALDKLKVYHPPSP